MQCEKERCDQMKYLPFGREIVLTDEQQAQQKRKFDLYDEYGIPYGIFDGTHVGEQFRSQKDKDRDAARILIMQGKDIPEDLKERLLSYKNQEQKMKRQG